jgi:hypothetical protein
MGAALGSHPLEKLLQQRRVVCGGCPLLDRRLVDPLQMPNEQSGSADYLAATGTCIMAAMTPDEMPTETPKGDVIQIRGKKTSPTSPANDMLRGSNVLACGDRRITAQRQHFCESLDERSSRTAADLPDASRRVKIL